MQFFFNRWNFKEAEGKEAKTKRQKKEAIPSIPERVFPLLERYTYINFYIENCRTN